METKDLKIGGRYNWRNQPERLTYMGSKFYPGDRRRWHQFALVSKPGVCWSEVLDEDIQSFEESEPEPAVYVAPKLRPLLAIPSMHATAKTRRPGENRAAHRARRAKQIGRAA